MRAPLATLAMLLSVAGLGRAAGVGNAPQLSSQTDFTRPGARDLPVTCKAGDFEFFAGRTMGEVFGEAWPAPPPATSVEPPRVSESAPPAWPRGLAQDHAVAVVAVLIGADGRAIEAKAICASTSAMSGPAVRAAMRSRYQPARFDGVPAVAVAVRPYVFGLRDAAPRAGRSRR